MPKIKAISISLILCLCLCFIINLTRYGFQHNSLECLSIGTVDVSITNAIGTLDRINNDLSIIVERLINNGSYDDRDTAMQIKQDTSLAEGVLNTSMTKYKSADNYKDKKTYAVLMNIASSYIMSLTSFNEYLKSGDSKILAQGMSEYAFGSQVLEIIKNRYK